MPEESENDAKKQAEVALQMEIMSLYESLNRRDDPDGIDFVGSTAQAIAYERNLESKRDDRLFNDHLAEHFIGTKGEKCSKMVNLHLGVATGIDNVHLGYTAARTKLINDELERWIDQKAGSDKLQVVNLGAGVDTRAFWVDALKKVESYVEVDTEAVNNFKSTKLDSLNATPLCSRLVVSQDFSKESVKDLPKHGFDAPSLTCWILEGLVMYLTKEVNLQMMNEITDLSKSGSFLILNFADKPNGPVGTIEDMSAVLKERGWIHEKTLFFGDAEFDFGRFQKGNKPTTLGFAFYKLA